MRNNYPTYNKAVEAYVQKELPLFKKLSAYRSLSRVEKTLLKTRRAILDNDMVEVNHLLQSIQSIPCTFLKAEKQFLLGLYYHMRADYEQSLVSYQQAVKYYSEVKDRRGQFLSNYNLWNI